jgi:hypothetical protein
MVSIILITSALHNSSLGMHVGLLGAILILKNGDLMHRKLYLQIAVGEESQDSISGVLGISHWIFWEGDGFY